MAKSNKGGGRPRLSVAEKKKKGTLQKCRDKPALTLAPDIEAPPPAPEWLGETGRSEFLQKADLLDRQKMLQRCDLTLLTALAKEWQNYVAAEQMLDQHSRFYAVKDEAGQVRYWGIHPAHTIAQQHLKSYITLCNEFGFSPASRSRLNVQKEEKTASKAAGLLKKAV